MVIEDHYHDQEKQPDDRPVDLFHIDGGSQPLFCLKGGRIDIEDPDNNQSQGEQNQIPIKILD